MTLSSRLLCLLLAVGLPAAARATPHPEKAPAAPIVEVVRVDDRSPGSRILVRTPEGVTVTTAWTAALVDRDGTAVPGGKAVVVKVEGRTCVLAVDVGMDVVKAHPFARLEPPR